MAYFFVRNSATDYFLMQRFFDRHSSGYTGSNDNGLEFVSCLGAEKKSGQTGKHTHRFWVLYI